MASGEQQIEGFDDLVAIGDLDAMVEQYYRELDPGMSLDEMRACSGTRVSRFPRRIFPRKCDVS